MLELPFNKSNSNQMRTLCSKCAKSCDVQPGGFDNISERSCEFILNPPPYRCFFLFWHCKSKSRCTLISPFTPPHVVFLSRNPAHVHSPTQLTSEEFVDL